MQKRFMKSCRPQPLLRHAIVLAGNIASIYQTWAAVIVCG
jgi:hypothetical protein